MWNKIKKKTKLTSKRKQKLTKNVFIISPKQLMRNTKNLMSYKVRKREQEKAVRYNQGTLFQAHPLSNECFV